MYNFVLGSREMNYDVLPGGIIADERVAFPPCGKELAQCFAFGLSALQIAQRISDDQRELPRGVNVHDGSGTVADREQLSGKSELQHKKIGAIMERLERNGRIVGENHQGFAKPSNRLPHLGRDD